MRGPITSKVEVPKNPSPPSTAPSRTVASIQSVGRTSGVTLPPNIAATPSSSPALSSDASTVEKATASLAKTSSQPTKRECTEDKGSLARSVALFSLLQLRPTPKHLDPAAILLRSGKVGDYQDCYDSSRDERGVCWSGEERRGREWIISAEVENRTCKFVIAYVAEHHMYSMTRAIPSLECWYHECPFHFSSTLRLILSDLMMVYFAHIASLSHITTETSLDNNASNRFLIHQYQYQYLLLLT